MKPTVDTLEELVNRINERNKKDNINSKISVFVTMVDTDKRSTVNFDTDSVEYEIYKDCTVSDLSMIMLGEKDYLDIIVIDLDKQFGGGE